MYRSLSTIPVVTEEALADARIAQPFLAFYNLYPIADEATALWEARKQFVPAGLYETPVNDNSRHSVELSADGNHWLVTLTIVGD